MFSTLGVAQGETTDLLASASQELALGGEPAHVNAMEPRDMESPSKAMGLLLLRAAVASSWPFGRAQNAGPCQTLMLDRVIPMRFVDPQDARRSAKLFACLAQSLAQVDSAPLLTLEALSDDEIHRDFPAVGERQWPVFFARADFSIAQRTMGECNEMAEQWLSRAVAALPHAPRGPFFEWSAQNPIGTPVSHYRQEELAQLDHWLARAEAQALAALAPRDPAAKRRAPRSI